MLPKKSSKVHINLIDPVTGEMIVNLQIPDTLNTHLCSAGRNLGSHFANAPLFVKTLHDVANEFQNDRISSDEVPKLVDKIKIHKSPAIDGLTSPILKDAFGTLLNFDSIDHSVLAEKLDMNGVQGLNWSGSAAT